MVWYDTFATAERYTGVHALKFLGIRSTQIVDILLRFNYRTSIRKCYDGWQVVKTGFTRAK